ncbi:hypothetical protein ABEW61_19375 [Paenibacillus amylolyticus]|uniref:hypothetical protein n=1 Tax=Paenibacillus amylolyticus TaxID=1451 RepID=UPI003D2BA002
MKLLLHTDQVHGIYSLSEIDFMEEPVSILPSQEIVSSLSFRETSGWIWGKSPLLPLKNSVFIFDPEATLY